MYNLNKSAARLGCAGILFLALQPVIYAQGRAGAPVDLTGYYVSVVTEDWRYRMVTPLKGDVASVPLNAAGRQLANAWDPGTDEAAGQQCKAYGAPALMRIPGRIHITWQDENTLKIESDAGTQTRLLYFGAPSAPAAEPTLQGFSAALWETPGAGRGGRGGGGGANPAQGSGLGPGGPVPNVADPLAGPGAPAQTNRRPAGGSLKVVTTRLKPGYLRKNGVPYSSSTVLTEYYSRTMEPNGDSWLIITTAVEDPQYLNGVFLTSTNFKRQADGSGWSPTACTAR